MCALIIGCDDGYKARIRSVLRDGGGFTDIAEACGLEEAMDLVSDCDVTTVIVDIDTLKTDWLTLVSNLRAVNATLSVIVMSSRPVKEYAARAALIGVRSFLPKGCLPVTIRSTVHRFANGKKTGSCRATSRK